MISRDETHHLIIGTFQPSAFAISDIEIALILILEHACFLHAQEPQLHYLEAFDKAYSRYKSSDTHNAVKSQFSAPLSQYSIPEFTEFILGHRL